MLFILFIYSKFFSDIEEVRLFVLCLFVGVGRLVANLYAFWAVEGGCICHRRV